MLPELKKINEYAPLDEPRTVRLRFCKKGALQYISHLDLQRTFVRILARAELPLWYTQGFNPHPKLVFALPLQLGTQSECELVDIKLVRDMPCEDLLKRLSLATTAELDFTDAYVPNTKFADIAAAEYEFLIECDNAEKMAESISVVLTTSPLTVTKKSKSGDKEIDIIPLIRKVDVKAEKGACRVLATVAAGSNENLRPELLVEALRKRLILLRDGEEYSILRRKLLKADLTEFR